jgi:hypothetical protein
MLLRCGATRSINQCAGFAGLTALGDAAFALNARMIELLLAAGADPDALDGDYCTAHEHLPPRETSDPVRGMPPPRCWRARHVERRGRELGSGLSWADLRQKLLC